MPGVARIARMSNGGNNRVDFEDRAQSTRSIDTPVEFVEGRSTGISNLLLMVESRCFLIVDPFEGHAGDIGAQDQLRERTGSRARDDPQVILASEIGAV